MERRRFCGRRAWCVRIIVAALSPVLVLLLIEGCLRLCGYGHVTSYFIPSAEKGIYLSNPRFDWRFFGQDLSREEIPTVIRRAKPADTYRILVLGGSAARGTPNPAFSFSRILETMLAEAFPQVRFEVINTGMTAINSHVVREIAQDCARLRPDLYVVYMGNNEVVGPYGPGTTFGDFVGSMSIIRMSVFFRSSRYGQLVRRLIRPMGPRTLEWGGMAMFTNHRIPADDPRLSSVYRNFRTNLHAICRSARRVGAGVILCTVLVNLRDFPPFSSAHRAGLTDDQRTLWAGHLAQGLKLAKAGDCAGALSSYGKAAAIDDRHAELHFRMGRCYLEIQRLDAARKHFVLARNLDTLRFRADSRINEVIRSVAGDRGSGGVHLLDLDQEVARAHPGLPGIAGSDLFHEHAHFRFPGNYVVARSLFRKVVTSMPAKLLDGKDRSVEPPSISRCASLTTFTLFDRYAAAKVVAQMTNKAPFPKTAASQAAIRAQRLLTPLTPEAMATMAALYALVLDRRPNDFLLRSSYADLQLARQEYAEAAAQYRLLLGRYPHLTAWRYLRGDALFRVGEYALAVEEFRRVLEESPHHFGAQEGLGAVLSRTGRPEEAIVEFRKALTIRPEHPGVLVQLGWAHARLGRTGEARDVLGRALSKDPEFAPALRALRVLEEDRVPSEPRKARGE